MELLLFVPDGARAKGTIDSHYDRSVGSISLQGGGQQLFSHYTDGPFSFEHTAQPGEYRLEIETVAEIKTTLDYQKSVDWEMEMSVQEVPEPGPVALFGIGLVVMTSLVRRTQGRRK